MDINRYRYIAMVARTKNITKAAEALHISQPALTKALRKTEEELGLRLFERDAVPIRLTYAGERYLAEIKKILNVQETLDREMAAISTGRKGRVTVGVPVESASAWLPPVLPEFVETHPDVEVKIYEGNSDSFERGLLDGTLDFCIYTLPVLSSDLDYEIVEENPVFLVSSDRHPFARDADPDTNGPTCPQYLDPRRLNGEKLLTLTPDRGMYRTAMQVLERHGVRVEIVLQLTSNYTISSLAAAGLGLAFTTHSAGMRMLTVPHLHPVFYTVDDPIFTRKTVIAFRKGNCLSPAAQDLADLTKAMMSRLPKNEIAIRRERYGSRSGASDDPPLK